MENERHSRDRQETSDPYYAELRRILQDPEIRRMKMFGQHSGGTTLDHVVHVAIMSHRIEQALHLRVDERAMLRGAILHDYYLYDFRTHPIGAYEHGTTHAQTALQNAEKRFHLSAKERNIIYSHMWPLNLTHLPKSKEAWIVQLSDKICAFEEMVLHIHKPADTQHAA